MGAVKKKTFILLAHSLTLPLSMKSMQDYSLFNFCDPSMGSSKKLHSPPPFMYEIICRERPTEDVFVTINWLLRKNTLFQEILNKGIFFIIFVFQNVKCTFYFSND